MSLNRSPEYMLSILRELLSLTNETEWVEFKKNNHKPEDIGEYISALANSAALNGKVNAYLIWGIDDETHDVLGTIFKPTTTKIGNEELENWLLKHLSPKIHFCFHELEYKEKNIVLMEIWAAFQHPVQFKNIEYIRVGSYKKKLKDYPEKERQLWRFFDQIPFEKEIALENLTSQQVLQLLSYPAYFELLELPLL